MLAVAANCCQLPTICVNHMQTVFDTWPFIFSDQPRVAVSACLMGEAVRYDGSAKPLAGLDRQLAPDLLLHSFCPEVAAGLGTPRPPVQLVASDNQLRALGRDKLDLDVSAALHRSATDTLGQLTNEGFSAYILKARSPSCGINNSPLFNTDRQQIGFASGLLAAQLQAKAPWLVLRDEQQLATAEGCRCFIFLCRLVNDLLCARREGQFANALKHHRQHLYKQQAAPVSGQEPSETDTAWSELSEQSAHHQLTTLRQQCERLMKGTNL